MSDDIKASFNLANYSFTEFSFQVPNKKELEISFILLPSGKFHSKNSIFELTFFISCKEGKELDDFLKTTLIANFKFENNPSLTFETIPPYFYNNSLAILFPYIRAFISTMTLQANVGVIILPTLNLTRLERKLRDSTIHVEEV